MSDAGKRSSARRSDAAGGARRCEDAMTALAAIMADQGEAPVIRIMAANSVLAWSSARCAPEVAAGGKEQPKLARVAIEWSDPTA